ncbi:hypothetical protein FACS1894123_08220 [Bacteroidia bacterium]|nr:hypothetical protein FACS1894123_08220 [Bacteroidia bacterium]
MISGLVAVLVCVLSLTCSDDVKDQFYTTFEEELITSYLEKNPERYSDFLELLKASGVANLLNAYGTYTCFAPTNEAVQAYYAERNTSFDQLTPTEARDLVYNHILPVTLNSIDFPQGVVSTANLSEKFLNISYTIVDSVKAIIINDRSRVVVIDQDVHNGVIHTVDAVILSSKIQLPEIIQYAERFNLFTEALFATGLSDSLRLMDDKNYVPGTITSAYSGKKFITPPYLKRGYTAFVESDSVYALNGINNLNDLKQYAATVYDEMYPADKNITDITNRKNSLNRFVAYHLMNKIQASNEFMTEERYKAFIPNTVVQQYNEMMCPNTLMEITTPGNLINKRKDNSAVGLLTTNHEAMNGIFHEIDGIMTYDRGVEDDVLNKKLRIDIATMMPELITNKLRAKFVGDVDRYMIPQGYFANMSYTDETQVHYFGCKCWTNYDLDELLLSGKYDFTLRIPPIPPGRYEIRIGYIQEGGRGVAQVYFDGQPCGIPLNMSIGSSDPKIGYLQDNATPDNGVENDKMMRNRGYIKGPTSIYVLDQSGIARDQQKSIRRILTTQTFSEASPHTLRVKSVEERTDRQYHLDYMEFVPSSYLEKEGRD